MCGQVLSDVVRYIQELSSFVIESQELSLTKSTVADFS